MLLTSKPAGRPGGALWPREAACTTVCLPFGRMTTIVSAGCSDVSGRSPRRNEQVSARRNLRMKTVYRRKRPVAANKNKAPEHYDDLRPEVQNAWGMFLKAYKVVLETIDRETVAGGGMSVAEFELMLYVDWAGGSIRFINLSKVSLLSQAQISRRVASLQEKGFLHRVGTDTDRRATFAVLTDKGRDAFEAAQKPFVGSLHRNFVDRIPADKLADFSAVLASNLDEPNFPEADMRLIFAGEEAIPEAARPLVKVAARGRLKPMLEE